MRFLVTGGNGFIGCYISKALKIDGHEVTTLGRSSMNDIVIDLSISTYEFKTDFDYIIHTAGIVHKEEHINSFNTSLILKDIAITENLLKSIVGINFKKIIYLSSVSVYGLINGHEIGVDTQPKPTNGYGFSKLINEKIIQSQIELSKTLIIRLPLVNGPNAKGNIRKAQQALKKKRMVVFSENNSLKSILEISDLYSFIVEKSKDINGIQQIKSYDINFNDFVRSLCFNKPLILPKIVLQFGIRVSKFLFLSNLNKTLRKISTTLTFKNSI